MYVPKLLKGVTLLMLGLPIVATAAEWSAKPRVVVTTGYNDNVRLAAGTHDPVWESSLAPSLFLGVATQTDGLTADGGFAVRRYIGGSGIDSSSYLNREDYHLNVNAHHNTERNNLRFNVGYTQDSTLDSELDQGIITNVRVTRDYLVAGPTWTSSLSPLTSLDMSYQASFAKYSNMTGVSNLVDYDFHAASASITHALTERTKGLLMAGYSRYLPDNTFESSSTSLQAGLTTNFDETLTASIQAGERWTSSDTPFATGFCVGAEPGAGFPDCNGGIPFKTGTTIGTIKSTSAVFGASLIKQLETGSLSANLSRTSSPSAYGVLLDATHLLLSGEYRFSETLRSDLTVEYTRNDTITNHTGEQTLGNQDFYRITPGITWQWQRQWSLSGEVQIARLDTINHTTARRNAVYLTLTYQPLALRLSR